MNAPTGAPATKATLWTRPFVLAWVANFLHCIGFHAYVHAPGWIESRGASEVGIGLLVATMSLAAILARPTIGRLMDTRGRRVVVLVGGCIHIASALLYLAVDSLPLSSAALWPAIVAVRIVHGVAIAALFSVLFTCAADLIPASRRAEGIALFGISGMIPLALGGLIGDWVIIGDDYRGLFLTAALFATGGLLVSLELPETRVQRTAPERGFWAAAVAPELRPLWFVGTVFAMGLAAYFAFLKTYLLATPELGTMGQFFGAYALSAVLLRLFFGWVPERVGLIRVLVPSMLLGGVGLATIAVATGPTHLIAAAVACGIGHGFAFPILSALVVSRAREDERGSAVALFTALFDLGALLGGPIFGLALRLTTYPATFAFAATLVTVATVIYWIWDRPPATPTAA